MPKREHGRIEPYIYTHPEIQPFMDEIASAFNQLYPVAAPDNNVLLQARNRNLHFFSLDIQKRGGNTLLSGIDLALTLAVDESHPAYSSHGVFRHRTFHEVIGVLREFVQKVPGQLQLSVSTRIIEDELQPSFVLETPDYQRKTYRPHPLSWVMQLAKSDTNMSHEKLYKQLRKVTSERGIAFGIIAAIYAGVPESEIVKQIFQNKDQIRNLKAQNWLTIPTGSRLGDYQLISEMWHKLMTTNNGMIYPSFRPESYGEALDIAKKADWLPSQEDLLKWYYEFDETQDTVKALAVFTSASHVVSDILLTKMYTPESRKLLQPAIDQKYGNTMTSRVKTGYFIFKNYRNLWTPQEKS